MIVQNTHLYELDAVSLNTMSVLPTFVQTTQNQGSEALIATFSAHPQSIGVVYVVGVLPFNIIGSLIVLNSSSLAENVPISVQVTLFKYHNLLLYHLYARLVQLKSV